MGHCTSRPQGDPGTQKTQLPFAEPGVCLTTEDADSSNHYKCLQKLLQSPKIALGLATGLESPSEWEHTPFPLGYTHGNNVHRARKEGFSLPPLPKAPTPFSCFSDLTGSVPRHRRRGKPNSPLLLLLPNHPPILASCLLLKYATYTH